MKPLDISFKYNVDYDYDTHYQCSENGCNSEGICRCSTIDNVRIGVVDIASISSKIFDLYFDRSKSQVRDSKINTLLFGVSDTLNIYCIDRVLRHYKIWDNEKWEIDVIGGYYGQEIGDVTLVDAMSIGQDIFDVLSLNTIKEKVEFLLKMEYGYILPELVGADYEITTISIDDVVFGSDGHYVKIQTKDLSHYDIQRYSGIRGIVKRDSDKFKIVDGYHRMYAFKTREVSKVKGKKVLPIDQVSVILVK